ncbi:hypothetical protein AB0M45_32875 [Nocardia sp. NPDC051787]|uniref:DUF6928 family protein n=1 Tax=Nocardia sp. NPDC051787 TaxID=3155415 RepID=UPI00341F9218
MGAKTAMLVHADTDPIPVLRSTPVLDRVAANEAATQLFPGRSIDVVENRLLGELGIPDRGLVYIGCYPGVRMVCGSGVYTELPSRLPPHLIDAKPGRRVYAHSMYSVTDSLAFALWENDILTRSLSLSPDAGVREDVGEPLSFEQPYWAGECPVDAPEYRLDFHPLELGEDALRSFFGFVLEGVAGPGEAQALAVPLCGFLLGPPGSAPAAGASVRVVSENGACRDDPSRDMVSAMLNDLTAPNNNYLILDRLDAEQVYIQTYRHGDGSFELEYRDGGPHAHFQTVVASVAEVITAFTGWMDNEPRWRNQFSWTKLEGS